VCSRLENPENCVANAARAPRAPAAIAGRNGEGRGPDDDDDDPEFPIDQELTGLEIFDDEAFSRLTSYFYREPMPGEPEGQQHGYCLKLFGQIDPDQVKEKLGGGRYRVLMKEGQKMVRTARVKIAGPPVIDRPAPPPPPPAATLEPAHVDRVDRLERLFERFLERAAAPAAPAASRLEELQQLASVAASLRPPDTLGAMPQLFGLVEKSFEAGRRVSGDGDSAGGLLKEVISGIMSVVEARREAAPARPVGGAPQGAPAPRPAPSSANVVEDPTPDDPSALFLRPLGRGASPGDAAQAIETLLDDAELARLLDLPEPVVVDLVGKRVPNADAPTRERVAAFVRATLAELRNPPADEGAGGEE
jgi:hypothetical protein